MKILVAVVGMLAFLILLMLILSTKVSGLIVIGLILWLLFCILWFAIVSISFDLNEFVNRQNKV